ncbi:MAG: hypothetical protein ACI82A_003935 [Candidatus Azotimanducaceae bacterium]
MDTIYHLALRSEWEAATLSAAIYYPPTYEQDGFTHGTGNPDRLLAVANHFYQRSQGDWVCLAMTETSLAATGVEVKFEPAADVGHQDGHLNTADPELFPHLYGGIAPVAVHGIYPVVRTPEGQFVRIDMPSLVQ